MLSEASEGGGLGRQRAGRDLRGSALAALPACRRSSRGAPLACSARRATSCMTLPPLGVQISEMPTSGELMSAAQRGDVDELHILIAAGADIEERDEVRDDAGTGISAVCCSLVRFRSWPGGVKFVCSESWLCLTRVDRLCSS